MSNVVLSQADRLEAKIGLEKLEEQLKRSDWFVWRVVADAVV